MAFRLGCGSPQLVARRLHPPEKRMVADQGRARPRPAAAFTLVELMIVVVIIGVLAAIAIPAFSRYVKKSRTAEASVHLNKMWSGSVTYYEADHADTDTVVQPKQFPIGGTPQEATCCSGIGGRCPGSAPEYVGASGAGWIALHFNVAEPHLFRPSYTATGTGTAAKFTASVNGDLDCDGTLSTFTRTGMVNAASGDVQASAAAFVNDELE
jgi:prepilin-type N-terminal cleavage/methylation domain-containing protein